MAGVGVVLAIEIWFSIWRLFGGTVDCTYLKSMGMCSRCVGCCGKVNLAHGLLILGSKNVCG